MSDDQAPGGGKRLAGLQFGLQQVVTLITVATTTAVGSAVTMARLGADMRATNATVESMRAAADRQAADISTKLEKITDKVGELDRKMAVFEDRYDRRAVDPKP